MNIQSVQIRNYRSIENLIISINQLQDGSRTYGLIGVNEAGKSSILKALALKENLVELSLKDFRSTDPIEVTYKLNPSESEIKKYIELANTEPAINVKDLDFREMTCTMFIQRENISTRNFQVDIKEDKSEQVSLLEERLKILIVEQIPKAIFWTAEAKYLIDRPISKADFSADPVSFSIPLKNCFQLAGISDVSKYLSGLNGTPDEEELENVLGEKVTEHIKVAWPNHPIQITFRIAEGMINFHVKDEGVKIKAKTADQRSDGFKQFVSFLLTISAQSKNEELRDSILLLDEPETHLHPQAQEYLLSELIKITKNSKNNLCFFATHSLFMIDKNDLGRNYKILKTNDKTALESFSNRRASYARVSYEVYGIPTTDLHNELYGLLQAREDIYKIDDFDNYLLSQNLQRLSYIKQTQNGTQNQSVTLPTKIRNIIHHPENLHNSFTAADLKNSIDAMLSLV